MGQTHPLRHTDQCVRLPEESNTQTFSRSVVLGDKRWVEPPGGVNECVTTDGRHRLRSLDTVCAQGRVLRDLADLELQCPSVVDNTPAMPAQPAEHCTRVLGAVAVSPGVGGRTHAVVEDTVRRFYAKIEHSAIEKPLFEWKTSFAKTLAEGLDPCCILVNDVDLPHPAERPACHRHHPFLLAFSSGVIPLDFVLSRTRPCGFFRSLDRKFSQAVRWGTHADMQKMGFGAPVPGNVLALLWLEKPETCRDWTTSGITRRLRCRELWQTSYMPLL